MRPLNKWFVLRLAIIGSFAFGGISFPHPPYQIPWLNVPFAFFGFFIGLFVQLGIAISRGGARYVWRRPSWYANPFTKSQPLQFFHMGAFCFMALGIVALMCGSWDWHHGAPLPLFALSSGLGIWAFVRVFCRVFRKRMDEPNTALEPTPAAP